MPILPWPHGKQYAEEAKYKGSSRVPESTAAVGRFDRSRGRSIESIGSVGSVILRIFRFFCHVGELEICLVSKFQLCTTLGGRKNAEKPKCECSEFSVRSVRYSIRFDRYCVRGSWWTALRMGFFKRPFTTFCNKAFTKIMTEDDGRRR